MTAATVTAIEAASVDYKILRSEPTADSTTWHLVSGGRAVPGRVRWVETDDTDNAAAVVTAIDAVLVDGY